jgi:hypothetical protein
VVAHNAGFDALEQVRSALGELTEAEILTSTTRQRDPLSGLKFDFLFEISSPNGREKAAALLVGPYNNHNMYRDRCDEWVERAFALAWVFDRVMLALPKVANSELDYLNMYKVRIAMIIRAVIERNEPSQNPPKIYVAHIYDPLKPAESEALKPFGT